MALSLEAINKVAQRARVDAQAKVGIANALRSFFKHANDVLKNPDLQIVQFVCSNSADVVIADAACKVYCLAFTKPAASTTNAWFKGSDHATTTAAAADIASRLVGTGGGGRGYCLVWHDGLPHASGLTVNCHTTVSGNTKSNDADCAAGFAIIGAA